MTIALFIPLLLLVVLLFLNTSKLKQKIKSLTFNLAMVESERKTLATNNASLQAKLNQLSKYEGIIDAETKAQEVLLNAERLSRELRNEAEQIISSAKDSAKEIINNAKNTKRHIDLLLIDSEKEAKIIIQAATERAEEIAGEAYHALQNASEYEKMVNAMRNIIEGYGEKYLVPTFNLLDDLADEFGHTEAGEKLKLARKRVRKMIENGIAADCEYVELSRKKTAINFVLDAFNGKVDSILAKVKKDNYGTLMQMIKDAFQIVNNNGKAFRNAAITDEYLNVRLDELKWAVIAQELKWNEQEEQRRIKEQIREEEKARREYERAMKDAQREEETLKKLIEKAQTEVAKANQEQKVRFEEQLIQLQQKLKEAEDKNQRAISMAQQTKSGNVYVISNIGSFGENVYKIGMTRRLEPLDRIRELGDASVPFEFDVHAMIFSDDAPSLERSLHKAFLKFQMNKVNPKKEFFKVLLKDIKDEIEIMGYKPKWTLTAEARQYKESLALEHAMEKDKQLQQEWIKDQLETESISVEEEDLYGAA